MSRCSHCEMDIPEFVSKCPYCHEHPGTFATDVYDNWGLKGCLLVSVVVILGSGIIFLLVDTYLIPGFIDGLLSAVSKALSSFSNMF